MIQKQQKNEIIVFFGLVFVCGSNDINVRQTCSIYSAAGNPYALKYNGTLYYYITNLQGDVLHIVNTSGTPVVSYTYDPYGKPENPTGTEATTLGVHNPLRYRGYVYDSETGLYYLQSRYYDPGIGRFVNADSLIGIDNILGNNQFAYCDCNPSNKVDYSGEDGQTIELGNGWYYRIDSQNTGTGTKRHIHVWNKKKEYIQNDDGSNHDKKRGDKGKLPKWLNDKLIEKEGWDYNGKRSSFYEGTSCEYWAEGIYYSFSDGTSAFRPYDSFSRVGNSIDFYESVYCQDNLALDNTTGHAPQTFFLPIIGPFSFPFFSLEFAWSFLPIPLLN